MALIINDSNVIVNDVMKRVSQYKTDGNLKILFSYFITVLCDSDWSQGFNPKVVHFKPDIVKNQLF